MKVMLELRPRLLVQGAWPLPRRVLMLRAARSAGLATRRALRAAFAAREMVKGNCARGADQAGYRDEGEEFAKTFFPHEVLLLSYDRQDPRGCDIPPSFFSLAADVAPGFAHEM